MPARAAIREPARLATVRSYNRHRNVAMTGTSPPLHKLRIMQVMASGPGSGGIEKHFFELCNRLAADHSVIAVGHPSYRSGLGADVHFESLGRFIGRRNPATIFRLVQLQRKWRPDVVHAHASRAAAIVLQASPFTSAVRIATVHGLKRRPLVFRGFDRVIAVSRGVAAQLRGVHADVIYNGITHPAVSGATASLLPPPSRSLPSPSLPSVDPESPVVVSVGRLDRVKGFDILVDAWQGIDGRLLIVGEGPELPALEARIQDKGLGDRVQLLGYRQDVPDLLAQADLTVIASRREGFGYTLAEALLLRRLVVSTDVPAANEVLPARFLVPCEDPTALRAAIVSTLSDRTAAEQAFEPVWEQAAAAFTIDAMVAATARLYREVTRPAAARTAG